MDFIARAWRDRADELLFHRRDVTAAMVELQAVFDRCIRRRRYGDDLTDERRGQHHEPVSSVDIVLNHLVVEHDDTHQLGPNPDAGRYAGCAESRQFSLRDCVETQGHDLTDVDSKDLGRADRHHHFVSLLRVGQPTLDSCQTILVEQFAVYAAHRSHIIQRLPPWSAVRSESHDGGPGKVFDSLDASEVGDLGRQLTRAE